MASVFLSHSARDAKMAAAIGCELSKLGVEAFDASEDCGQARYVRQVIKAAIRRADAFVLVIGAPDTASASWATYELGMAEALGKPILTLLSHNHVAAELPADLAGLPVASFDPAHAEQAAHVVVDRCSRPLEPPDSADLRVSSETLPLRSAEQDACWRGGDHRAFMPRPAGLSPRAPHNHMCGKPLG